MGVVLSTFCVADLLEDELVVCYLFFFFRSLVVAKEGS